MPLEDMPHAVSPVPSAGAGKSDGKGTYRQTVSAAYTSKAKEPPPLPVVPATAGLTQFIQPNDTDFHQLLRMPQRVPPGALFLVPDVAGDGAEV